MGARNVGKRKVLKTIFKEKNFSQENMIWSCRLLAHSLAECKLSNNASARREAFLILRERKNCLCSDFF